VDWAGKISHEGNVASEPATWFRPVHVHIALQQPATVFGEARAVPYLILDSKPDKPAEQCIILDALAS
jgi:hypothetical protein